jgi:hypothetical protein
LPPKELIRQVGRRLKPYGDRAVKFITDVEKAIEVIGVAKRDRGRACAISIGRNSPVRRSAADALDERLRSLGIEPMSDIGTTTEKPLVRWLRMVSSDLAVFVLWHDRVGCAALEHVVLYASLCGESGYAPAVLLVESETGSLPSDVRALQPLLRGRVEINTFICNQIHADQWPGYSRLDEPPAIIPAGLWDDRNLPNRVRNWIKQYDPKPL